MIIRGKFCSKERSWMLFSLLKNLLICWYEPKYYNMKILMSAFTCFLMAFSISFAQTGEEIVTQPSSYTMDETVDVLKAAMEEMDLNLMEEVDHGQAAADHALELRPTKVLIFGNPRVGTQLMKADQRAGLDLPLRILVWENEDGRVFLTYRSPSSLQEDFALEEQQEVLDKMSYALDKLSQKAVNQEP